MGSLCFVRQRQMRTFLSSAPATQLQGVAALVRGPLGWAQLGTPVTLHLQSARLAASCGQPTELSMLHHRPTDPIDAGIVADGLVEWVNHDNFEPLVPSIFRDPIGIQHT